MDKNESLTSEQIHKAMSKAHEVANLAIETYKLDTHYKMDKKELSEALESSICDALTWSKPKEQLDSNVSGLFSSLEYETGIYPDLDSDADKLGETILSSYIWEQLF